MVVIGVIMEFTQIQYMQQHPPPLCLSEYPQSPYTMCERQLLDNLWNTTVNQFI